MITRRHFIKSGSTLALALQSGMHDNLLVHKKTELDAHLWVYASRFPPNWDCTPILDGVFSELKYAGFSGVEIMESILRHDDAVKRLKELEEKYSLPLAGSSYNRDMWRKEEHNEILEDAEKVIERLHKAGGKMLGITVGDAQRKKTEEELDAQADVLLKIMKICKKNKIEPNLHNHTFEMEHDMFDFKGTIARVPDLKLGPDLNWLIRGGVDPVSFIKTYHFKMVYMHLRDQDAGGRWTEALGEGITDFNAIANALKEVNYSGKAAVELAFEGPPVRPVKESWKISREYVRKVFGW